MIPKKIHYIWLGGRPKDKLAEICLLTWKDKMPEYEMIEWNESNLDLDEIAKESEYCAECRKRKLYAFMADYLRIKILYEQGGIYIDTDVQAIQSLNPLMDRDLLLGYESFSMEGEKKFKINGGFIAAEKENWFIKKVYDFYHKDIMNSDRYIITEIMLDIYEQLSGEEKSKLEIFPQEYFSPFDSSNCEAFSQDLVTKNTYTIHWYLFAWKKFKTRAWLQVKHIKNPIQRYLKMFQNKVDYDKYLRMLKKNLKYKL